MCTVTKHYDVAAVIGMIRHCLDDKSFDQLADACKTLQDAVCNAENEAAFWKVDGITALADVLTQCTNGPKEVLVQACAAIKAVSFTANDLFDCSVGKAIMAVRNVIYQTNYGPEEVRIAAFAALDKIMRARTAVDDDAHHATCNVACDIKTLVDKIKQCLNDGSTELLTHACWVLRQRLRARNPRVMLSDVDDGTQTLVDVVTRYKDGPTDVLKHACSALFNTTICTTGQIIALVDVLKLYADGPVDLVELACLGLYNAGANTEMCHEVLKALRRHRDGPAWLLNSCCGVLVAIARDKANKASCAAAGGIRDLLELVARFSEGPVALQTSALAAIWSISYHQFRTGTLWTVPSDVVTITNILTRYHDGPDALLTQACGALLNITWNETNRALCQREFGACGGIKAVVPLLWRCCSKASQLLTNACGLLVNVTTDSNDENVATCGAAGGVQVVIEIIKTALAAVAAAVSGAAHDASKSKCHVKTCACTSQFGLLLTKSCWALRNLVKVNQHNRIQCSQYGGIKVLIDAMPQLCLFEADLRYKLCEVLDAMTVDSVDNQLTSGAKGIKAALHCISLCGIDDVDKLQPACALLSNITATYDECDAQLVCGIETVLCAVQRHWQAKSPPLFLKHACQVIANISKHNAQAKVVCNNARGVETMINILTHYCTNTGTSSKSNDYFTLLETTCCALRSMTTSNAANYAKCSSCGGLKAVVDIIRAFESGPASLLYEALGLMCDLVSQSKTSLIVGGNQYYGVETVLRVLRRSSNELVVLEQACAVLCSITWHPVDIFKCKQCGGVSLLASIVKQYSSKPGFAYLVHQARQALLNIT